MRLLLLFAFLSGIITSTGQTSKGDWILNGVLTFNHYTNIYPKQSENVLSGDFQNVAGSTYFRLGFHCFWQKVTT